jgi:hypothetical protein
MGKRGKVSRAIGSAKDAAGKVAPPSPNPMTNLILADVALRVGGQLLRHGVERGLLGQKYGPGKAKKIVKGRSMAQTLLGTAVARIATRSVPGAIVVGGGLLAKTLYDRRRRKEARAEGAEAVKQQIEDGE